MLRKSTPRKDIGFHSIFQTQYFSRRRRLPSKARRRIIISPQWRKKKGENSWIKPISVRRKKLDWTLKKAKKEAGIRKFTYIMFSSILVEGEEKNGVGWIVGGFLMAKNFVNFEKSFITNRSSLRLFFCYYNCCYYKEAAPTFWETFPTNFLPKKNGHCSKRCFDDVDMPFFKCSISVANFS